MPHKSNAAVLVRPRVPVFAQPISAPANVAWFMLFLLFSFALQLPGNVPYDGITVWYEAETSKLYAQHPPVLVLIWKLCETVVRGPLLFTALQLSALWLAAWLTISRLRPPFWLATLFYLGLLIYPPLLALSGVAVKDVFGAHLALLAFATALPKREGAHKPWIWAGAFVCATLATLIRYQFGLMLPVLCLLVWWQRRSGPAAIAIGSGLAAAAVTTALAVAGVMTMFTAAGPTDVQLSLRKMMIFDIAGVVANNPSANLPVFAKARVDVPKLKAEMLHEYSPVRVDTLWQVNGVGDSLSPHNGAFGRLRPVPDDKVREQWLSTMQTDPVPLIHHRVNAFKRVMGLGDIYECRPIRAGISWLPREQALAVQAQTYSAPVSARIVESRWFPVGTPFRAWFYVVVALGLVAGYVTGAVPREAALLSVFALAYEASFFVLPQACEVRYSYPVMLAVLFALGLFAFKRLDQMPN